MINQLAWLYWDPPKVAFTVPLIEREVVWYGILFVTGFILGYFVLLPIITDDLAKNPAKTYPHKIVTSREMAYFLSERLVWFIVAGTVLGARLGHVFFYDWEFYRQNPLEILQFWKPGLASHGGVLGVMLSLYLYLLYVRRWVPFLTFTRLLDMVSIPSALAACFIRLGNFMNQEIIGTPTLLPWAVVFGHPADGTAPFPRHPVQLYEALAYLGTFIILLQLWRKRRESTPEGTYIGLMLILIFSSRFILEFWKESMDATLQIPLIQMGQLLSVPFILLGVYFFFKNRTPFFRRGHL